MGGSPVISFTGEKSVWGLFFKEKTKNKQTTDKLVDCPAKLTLGYGDN
jgi:hypothetical protein